MRFSAIHKVTSYLMVASAFAALAISRELGLPLLLFTAVGMLFSSLAEPSAHAWMRSRLWHSSWNLATVLVFLWAVVEALSGEPLLAGVRFLCFLLVNKLWNRRGSRDYLQAYVVSFLMLVAGAALSTDLAYAACFAAYVVFATWTLTLFHLRREMEENYLLKHSDDSQSERVEVERILNSRRIVGKAFLAGTSLVSLGIFIASSALFLSLPRLGFGFFVAHGRRGVATIGFSERVDLGEYGVVKDNPQVVMRVELPGGPPDRPLHLRGVTFDHYQSGHWSRTVGARQEPLRRVGNLWLVESDRPQPLKPRLRRILGGSLVQQVYLEPLDTTVLFGAPMPLAFELPRSTATSAVPVELEARGAGEVVAHERHVDSAGRAYGTARKSGLKYTVYSELQNPAALGASFSTVPEEELAPYLEVPAGLPERIKQLARSLTEGTATPYEKARAIERHLRTRYRYTLDLEHDGPCAARLGGCGQDREPLDRFLFVAHAGHCEYFASAMSILLRLVGIPTRSVNGFLGGDWNSYGRYLAVRQGDAHSWVEVWLDGSGWATFDPTPPPPLGLGQRGVWHAFMQVLDTLELTWFKYVIEYDLGKQVELVERGRGLLASFSHPRGARRLPWRAFAVALGIAAGVAFLVRLARRGGIRPLGWRKRGPAEKALERALRALRARGYQRGLGETGRELADRASSGWDPGAAPFAELVERYYEARFGGLAVPEPELDRLAREVARARPPSTPAAQV